MASSQGSGTTNGLSLFFSQWFNLFRPKLPVFLSPIYPIYLDSIHIAICKKLKTTIICLCVNFFILITVPDHQIVINILIMYKISPTLKVCGKLRRASISGRMLLIHSRMIKGESIRDVWRETTWSYTRAWGDSTS